MAGSQAAAETTSSVEDEEAAIQANYDEHVCEFCGETLPDPGLSYLKHLDDSETCKWLWFAFRPHVQKEAGGS